jgi:uncharacterized protein YraI
MKDKRTSMAAVLAGTLGVIGIIVGLAVAVQTVNVSRETAGRSGPGSYYELKVLIPPATSLAVLETNKSWLKVTYENQQVWISENSLSEKTEHAQSPLSRMAFDGARVSASPIAVSAAIKGFWTRYTGVDKNNLAEIPVDGFDVSPLKFESFEKQRADAVSRDKLMKKYKLQGKYRKPQVPYVKEHQLGYTVASSVAEGSLLKNDTVITYVYDVGWYLADATERPDIRFIYFILDTDRINAISCPGGYIMFTRGLLEILNDESELAALLAHEMAHVIAGHGTRELGDDYNKISMQADDAFAVLNDVTGGASKVEQELMSIATRSASICRAPKLDEYEFEADRMALLYMARSGYDLGGQLRILDKLKKIHDREIDIFDLNYRNHPDFKKRMENLEKDMKNYREYSGQTFSGSFKENMVF